jgi:NAD-dependent SIR2 family protein deacetylase
MHTESGIVDVRSEKGGKYKDYEIENYGMEYFIERYGVLNYVLPTRFYQIIKKVLPENKHLLKIIRNRGLKYYDIYFVINYFNEKFENH